MRLIFFVTALLCASQGIAFRVRSMVGGHTASRVSTKRAALPVVSLGLVAKTVPVMYSLMSFNEYITHRYYQHTDLGIFKRLFGIKLSGGGHVEHHAETRDDMSLKTNDPRWMKSPAALMLDADVYRGTAFSWSVTGIMFIQLLLTCVPVMHVLGWSLMASIGWIIPYLGLHTLVWNALHPAMHGLPDIGASEGPPAALFARFRTSKLFQFLENNHIGHHVVGGRGNYNVCCPGCDNLFGTFVPESKWRAMQTKSLQQQQQPKEELLVSA
jgi:hypothetical protein